MIRGTMSNQSLPSSPQNSAKKPSRKKSRLTRPKAPVMSPEALERIGALEARLAALEGRLVQLEQESVLNIKLKGPTPAPEPWKWPTLPDNSDDARCGTCGNRYKDMTHYVCNHHNCPGKVWVGDNPNAQPIVTWGPGASTTTSILGTATCKTDQPLHDDPQYTVHNTSS